MACACLSLAVGALILLIIYLRNKYTYWKRHGIPSAEGVIPLFGHLLPLVTNRLHYTEFIKNIYETFKDSSMVGFYILTSPALLIRDPRLVKTILQTNFSSFHRNAWEIVPSVDPLVAQNPFFSNGDDWALKRKRLTNAFSSLRLKTMFVPISGVCKKFHDFLDRRLKQSDKYEVELNDLFRKFTGEVVANAGFSIEGFCFEDEPHPMAFTEVGNDFFNPSIINGILLSVAFFLPKLNKILKVKVIPPGMDRKFRNMIAANLAARENDATPRNDFLQLMIDLEKAQGGKVDKEAIAGHALSFYFDTFETSSIAMSFVGYQLAVHTDVQERLRKEVQSTIAKHGGQLTFDGLKEMKYMDQVIMESQRCNPAFGLMRKRCTEELELQGSDGLSYRVKPDRRIVISIQSLHMDPDYWTDPQVFDPDRFGEERKQEIEKMAYIPFGDGPRMCVGMRLALLQTKCSLATLLNNYKLELSPKTQLPLQMVPALLLTIPAGGLWANISKL